MDSLRRLALRAGHAAIRRGIRLPLEGFLDRYREQWLLADLLGRLGVTCVLDVGANQGQFALKLRAVGYRGRIISFEPIAEDAAHARRLADADPLWSVHSIALGAVDGLADLNVLRFPGGASVMTSFLDPLEHEPMMQELLSREVRPGVVVRRLDAVLPEVLPTASSEQIFLKSDTQGYDTQVLLGASGCLAQVVGVLVEVAAQPLYAASPGYLETLGMLERGGFSLVHLGVVNRTASGLVQEYDALLARREMLDA